MRTALLRAIVTFDVVRLRLLIATMSGASLFSSAKSPLARYASSSARTSARVFVDAIGLTKS